jgi:rRNA maturation endonuclease Nob1
MKSAYELAMERLEKESPTLKLSPEQKAEIADIESIARAKVAEKELFLKEQISKAMASGDYESVQQLERQLGVEVRSIQSDAEEKKERVRNRKG